MKITKKELEICIQVCINTYNGRHGKVVKDLLKKEKEFKEGHVEGITGRIENTAYIIFRGSDGRADWFDNFKFSKKPLSFIKLSKKEVPYKGVNPDIKVHRGFIQQYKTIKATILEHIIKERDNGCTRVIVTGHSLGGALATLCALDIQFHHPDLEIICIPIASPRVGNKRFTKSFNWRVPETYRFVYRNDSVCKVPYTFLGYKHVKEKVYLGSKLKWYEKLLFNGNPFNHYPEKKYQPAIKKLKWK